VQQLARDCMLAIRLSLNEIDIPNYPEIFAAMFGTGDLEIARAAVI
jgi:hypothetical protein